MQLVQNFAGRTVLGLRKYDHIKSLRWLPLLLINYFCVELHGYLDAPAVLPKADDLVYATGGDNSFSGEEIVPTKSSTELLSDSVR